ncbi:peptidase inhibitor family I36 protein [Lentzea sp. E54]|uniref:peptidase inhibitor family I36 protein n=1 Tax=Lentzea xerophila TaxID=3435883 RepID=UPI003DA4D132
MKTPSASAHYSQCPSGHFCMWEHSSYGGMFHSTPGSVSNVGSWFNDRATSVWNRTSSWVTVYEHSNYQFQYTCTPGASCVPYCIAFAPGSSDAAIEPLLNDAITSYRVGEKNPNCIVHN